MIGKTLNEAKSAWMMHQDVICPECENHIHENEKEVYFGEVWHKVCVTEDKMINSSADAEAHDNDPQQN